MHVLRYQRSIQLCRNSRPSKKAMHWLYLIFGSLSLGLVTSLTGCASNCPKLSEKQRPMPIDSVIDVSATEQKLERLQQDYLELLNSVKKTTNDGK